MSKDPKIKSLYYSIYKNVKFKLLCHIWVDTDQSSLSRLDKFQNCLHCLCGRRLFSPFPTDITSQAYHYFHGKCSSELHSLAPPGQTFTVRTHLVTSTGLNQPHSLLIMLVRRKFPTDSNSHVGAPLNTTILTSSSLRSLITYSTYIIIIFIFLLPPLASIPHISFNNILLWVALGP